MDSGEQLRDAQLKEALDSVRKYPEYRQQSIRIQQELDNILAVFDEAAKKQGGSVTSRHEWCYKALDTPEDAEIVSCYRKACEAVGLPCKLVGTFGMSDCNHLPQNGIEGIVVSSAMWNCHSTDLRSC